MVCDGEPEDREDQVTSADGESFDHRHAAASNRVSSVEGICSNALASFQAVRARTGLPRRAVAKVGREMPARRASSDRLQPRSAQATLTASADRTTTNPDRPTITAAGPLIYLAFPRGRSLAPAGSRALASAWTSEPPRRLADGVFNVPVRPRKACHVQHRDPPPRAIAGPDGSERPGGSDEGGRGRPESAALAFCVGMLRQQARNLALPLLGRSNEQDLVSGGARALGEVGRVRMELGSKATRLLGTAIPLEVNQRLAVRREQPAPSIRDWSAFVAFGVGALNNVFTAPVVKAVVWQLTCREGKVDEELVGLELVYRVKATLECVLRSSEVLSRLLVQPLGQCRRPPPREQVDRGSTHASRTHDHAPRTHESVVDEPAEPVLAAPRTGEEQRLELVAV